jgi:hypothetical protein
MRAGDAIAGLPRCRALLKELLFLLLVLLSALAPALTYRSGFVLHRLRLRRRLRRRLELRRRWRLCLRLLRLCSACLAGFVLAAAPAAAMPL